MSLSRKKSPSFSFGEKVTSPMLSSIDQNIEGALDKTVAGDTLSGVITVASGAGLTLASGSAVAHQSGSAETHASGSTDTYASGSGLTIQSGTSVTATINGSGTITLTGAASRVDAAASGAVIIASTTGAKIITSGGGTFEIGGASAFPNFTTSRSRSLSVDIYKRFEATGGTGWTGTIDPVNGFLTSAAVGAVSYIPFEPHNGSRLASIDVYYKVAASHYPQFKISYKIFRKPLGAIGTEDLFASGLQFVTGTDAASYFQAGTIVSHSSNCDQNHTVDTAAYRYFVELHEESGTSSAAGNRLYGIRVNYDTITSMAFQ